MSQIIDHPQVREVLSGVLDFIAIGGEFNKRAMDQLAVHDSSQQKAAALAPGLVEKMVKLGMCKESNKEAAAALLGSHAETLAYFSAWVDKYAAAPGQQKTAGLGKGADDPGKPAGTYDSLNSAVVGGRAPTGMRKASDLAMLKLLDAPQG